MGEDEREAPVTFTDFDSTFAQVRRIAKSHGKEGRAWFARNGVDPDSYESVYSEELKRSLKLKDPLCKARLASELIWYRDKRPYFNVYPVIEKKLLEISGDLLLSELFLPFSTIEIRTSTTTFLLHDAGRAFLLTVEMGNLAYAEFILYKRGHVKEIGTAEYVHMETDWPSKNKGVFLSDEVRIACATLACGVCLLAKDPSIVVPVVLNKHRKDDMTPEELLRYKEKAIEATGKTGWDVGRDMQFRQASCHYRNGCFAKYYVGKHHEAYPDNCDLQKAPIIKWRAGSVVNANNTPVVPTGFHQNTEVSMN